MYNESKEDDNNGAGCLIILGIIITSISIAAIFSVQAYGWLFLGVSFVTLGILSCIPKKQKGNKP
jgi:hypothetical protein